MAFIRRSFPKGVNTRTAVDTLVRTGELTRQVVDGVPYIGIPSRSIATNAHGNVRFLAPFDPLVWDRLRFEHFWGWKYKFEAYTPPAKRVRGYYAMPLFWIDRVVGWANIRMNAGVIDVDLGFIDKRPQEKDFRQELEAEIARVEFLKLQIRN